MLLTFTVFMFLPRLDPSEADGIILEVIYWLIGSIYGHSIIAITILFVIYSFISEKSLANHIKKIFLPKLRFVKTMKIVNIIIIIILLYFMKGPLFEYWTKKQIDKNIKAVRVLVLKNDIKKIIPLLEIIYHKKKFIKKDSSLEKEIEKIALPIFKQYSEQANLLIKQKDFIKANKILENCIKLVSDKKNDKFRFLKKELVQQKVTINFITAVYRSIDQAFNIDSLKFEKEIIKKKREKNELLKKEIYSNLYKIKVLGLKNEYSKIIPLLKIIYKKKYFLNKDSRLETELEEIIMDLFRQYSEQANLLIEQKEFKKADKILKFCIKLVSDKTNNKFKSLKKELEQKKISINYMLLKKQIYDNLNKIKELELNNEYRKIIPLLNIIYKKKKHLKKDLRLDKELEEIVLLLFKRYSEHADKLIKNKEFQKADNILKICIKLLSNKSDNNFWSLKNELMQKRFTINYINAVYKKIKQTLGTDILKYEKGMQKKIIINNDTSSNVDNNYFWADSKESLMRFFNENKNWQFELLPAGKKNEKTNENIDNIIGKIYDDNETKYIVGCFFINKKLQSMFFGVRSEDKINFTEDTSNYFELDLLKKFTKIPDLTPNDFVVSKEDTFKIRSEIKVDLYQMEKNTEYFKIVMFRAEIEDLIYRRYILIRLLNGSESQMPDLSKKIVEKSFIMVKNEIIENEDVIRKQIRKNVIDTKKKLIRAAKEYENKGPVLRFTVCDYAFGRDLDEFSKLKGLGIIKISSLNRDKEEYPIKRVYFLGKNKMVDLKMIYSKKISVNEEIIKRVFGSNRTDFYYLIPYNITKESGKLIIDFSKNRKDFELLDFPDNNSDVDSFLNNKSMNNLRTLDKDILRKFLIREFNLELELDKELVDNKENSGILNDENKQINILTQQIEKDPNNDKLYFQKGILYFNEMKFNKAIVEFSYAILKNDRNSSYFELRGRAYYNKKSYRLALTNFTKALRLNPKSSELFVMRGMMYGFLKRFKLALSDFDNAIKYNKKNATAYRNRAYTYIKYKKKYKKALRDIKKAIKIIPEDPVLYYELSCYYSLAGKKKKALESFEKAIRYGFKNIEKINLEKALDLIRKEKKFIKLLEAIKI